MAAEFGKLSDQFRDEDLNLLDRVQILVAPTVEFSLRNLLESWSAHVTKIIADLDKSDDDHSVWGAHDLIAALVARDHVENGILQLCGELRRRVRKFTDEIDQEFREVTEVDSDGAVPRVSERNVADRDWWWRRSPGKGPIHDELVALYGKKQNHTPRRLWEP
ncbi:hypothetical protein [Amycolatopsis sp. GM8]|uniref:hypothetical protein n=1 Tax=Amycolatopsis sp. GM8 TaxID=2896530 RepID=UPI001F25A8E6|nr:hypothetical protein [Amycolatopsis sp. GM8]